MNKFLQAFVVVFVIALIYIVLNAVANLQTAIVGDWSTIRDAFINTNMLGALALIFLGFFFLYERNR